MKKICLCLALFLFLLAALGTVKAMAEPEDAQKEPAEITVSEKPDLCPVCGNSTVVPIMYGLPLFTEELNQAVAEGKLVLGGCVISDHDPQWKCTSCGALFFINNLPPES